MQLTEEQKQQLRILFAAKGRAFEQTIEANLIARGIDAFSAHSAGMQCSRRVLINSMTSGAFAAIVLSALYTPVVGATAGISIGSVVGFYTLLQSPHCSAVRDGLLLNHVDALNRGR